MTNEPIQDLRNPNIRETHDPFPAVPIRNEKGKLLADEKQITELQQEIDSALRRIPQELASVPEVQERCLSYVIEAQNLLSPPVRLTDIVSSRVMLTKVQMEQFRVRAARISSVIVLMVVYMFAGVLGLAYAYGLLRVGTAAAQELNNQLVLGIPIPILVWSAIGSLTSMLLRAGNLPIFNRIEALRWLLFRPIVGVVMGVITYLMVIAGLIVFSGAATPRTPELLWVIAFVGSFSDTLSVNLLQRVLGRFVPLEGAKQRANVSGGTFTPASAEGPDPGRALIKPQDE